MPACALGVHTGFFVAWWSNLALYIAIPMAVLVAFGVVVALAFGAGGNSVTPTYRELSGPKNLPRLPESERDPASPLAPPPALAQSPKFQAVFDRISELNTTIQSYNRELLSLASPGASETVPPATHRDQIQRLHTLRDAAIGELVTVMGATLYQQALQIGGPRPANAARHQDLCHA